MYIIQTDFNLNGYYKIGVTTNLQTRLSQYRSGAVLEPRVHCYFPVKNIKDADKTMKDALIKYNIKREIYNCNNIKEIINILKSIQKKYNSKEIKIIPKIKTDNDIKNKNIENTINYKLTNLKNEINIYKRKQTNSLFISEGLYKLLENRINCIINSI